MGCTKVWIMYDTKTNELPVAVGTLREIAESMQIPYSTIRNARARDKKIRARYLLAEFIEDFEERDDI